MARKSKPKTSEDLVTKLNGQLTNSGARFLSAKSLTGGKVELVVEMQETRVKEVFDLPSQVAAKAADKVKARVSERKAPPGSLMSLLKNEAEKKDLSQRLEIANIRAKEKASLNQRYRDGLSNSYLDLREKGSEESKALDLYKRSKQEYYRTGIYGTHLDLLSNFAATGFYNEINNPEIKEYYDAWAVDTQFVDTVRKIFHDLFQYSVAYVLRATGPYEPHADGISSIPGKDLNRKTAAGNKAYIAKLFNEYIKKNFESSSLDFNKFSEAYDTATKHLAAKGSVPVKYTLLDPTFITLTSAGFFGAYSVTMSSKGYKTIKDVMKSIKEDPASVSKAVKDSISMLPPGLKRAITDDEDYTFKDEEISVIFLRKPDPEVYAKPRGSRAFDSFDYKDELKKADYATVDGIYNYILKITVGNDQHPVTDESVLDSLAEAFNTPQKAFSIVWNHTLDIEKITTTEVGAILGKAKYEPVDDEITAALGFARALIDGKELSADGATLITKSLQSEIAAARDKVTAWIYRQYREVAVSAGFNSYPVVRWKESVINTDKDSVTRASYMQMLDRKAISIQTYMREAGLDFDTEVSRMEQEKPLIDADILRAGSPYQETVGTESGPSGDQGRPKGQPTGQKNPTNPARVVKDQTKVKSPSQASIKESLLDHLGVDESALRELTTILNTLVDVPSSEPQVEDASFMNQDLKSLVED